MKFEISLYSTHYSPILTASFHVWFTFSVFLFLLSVHSLLIVHVVNCMLVVSYYSREDV